ncbi:hypothetical protein OBBRIDRAFT_787460 [Obba rivulosa]|uniref:Integral membrane protein n=1 Tax=Obba rivulosa TaxID=1052685 RepID=A0A8E2J7C4_9APHY|nr:hypothetical protein OBBRIDRAFT_787460 [Obba rivulosa]
MSEHGSPPSWPSLYNIDIELLPIQHTNPEQPGGAYLHNPNDVFRFTLYWTLVFYTPAFLFGGIYAFMNLTFPPSRPNRQSHRVRRPLSVLSAITYVTGADAGGIALRPYAQGDHSDDAKLPLRYRARARQNERRSRLTFALLVFFGFVVVAVCGAVVGSAIIGYVLAGLFKAAKFNMSTWIPFLGGLMQTLVGFLGLWPTVIDII